MSIVNIEHLTKIYGEKKIFDAVSLGIEAGDKIGIIGVNGTGKSTLLRIIAGLEEPDEGQVIRQNNLKIAYLPQTPVFPKDITVLDYVTGRDGDSWEKEHMAKNMLMTLGIDCFDEKAEILSGGQRKRIALAKVLLHPADLLILDEPTNHIDGEMAAWLEDHLRKYKGSLLMVTHDRYFLDRVTDRILEIDHGALYSYTANYSKFLEMKAEREEMAASSERKRKSILRMEIEWAKRGCRARTTKQKARLERLESLKNQRAPQTDAQVAIDAVHSRMGRKTVELLHISKGYDDHILIRDFSYILLKNQRLGIIGPNGCGKSTLMKLIIGAEKPDAGEVVIGDTIRIGYFAQEVPDMDGNQKVIDYVREVADYIETNEGRISASQMLERFLFDGAMQYSPVNKLSGGEKRRLYLMRILADAPNVLILDEPTNDLDIPTLTILEDFLQGFKGIIITVSHDRYFLDNIVDRIFAFEEGSLVQYEGDYSDYFEKTKGRREARRDSISGKTGDKDSGLSSRAGEGPDKQTKNDWKARQSLPKKLKFTYKEEKEFETIDEEIMELEEAIAENEKAQLACARDFVKLNALMLEEEALKAKLEEKMDRWVYLNDLAEQIQMQNEKTGKDG